MHKPLVSIILPTLLIGGAEKVLVELANQLSTDGWHIHIVAMSAKGPLDQYLISTVKLVDLRCNSFRQAIIALLRYYNSCRPTIVLTSLYATGLAAIAARLIARHKPKILVGAHNSLQAKVERPDNVKDKWFLLPLCRILFPYADGFIPVSNGVARELEALLSLPRNRIRTIYNPVTSDVLFSLAAEPVSHPWLVGPTSRMHKTLVSVGRLVEQKGFDVLLQALQLTSKKFDCRLILIGGGPLLSDLESTARYLGVSDIVDFVGWQTNPYKFVARADLFILSSRWEGLPTVLIEALACGCPVVSTNCRYGPEEILEGGCYGALASVDDPANLATQIIESLMPSFPHPATRARLIKRSLDFTVESSARQYASYFTEILANSSETKTARS